MLEKYLSRVTTYGDPVISWSFSTSNPGRCGAGITQRSDPLLPFDLFQVGDVHLIVVILGVHEYGDQRVKWFGSLHGLRRTAPLLD